MDFPIKNGDFPLLFVCSPECTPHLRQENPLEIYSFFQQNPGHWWIPVMINPPVSPFNNRNLRWVTPRIFTEFTRPESHGFQKDHYKKLRDQVVTCCDMLWLYMAPISYHIIPYHTIYIYIHTHHLVIKQFAMERSTMLLRTVVTIYFD